VASQTILVPARLGRLRRAPTSLPEQLTATPVIHGLVLADVAATRAEQADGLDAPHARPCSLAEMPNRAATASTVTNRNRAVHHRPVLASNSSIGIQSVRRAEG
jgi:hypothetical protein